MYYSMALLLKERRGSASNSYMSVVFPVCFSFDELCGFSYLPSEFILLSKIVP